MLNIPYSIIDGCNTLVGQAVMHRWQAVQFDVKCSIDLEPGGDETNFFFTSTLVSFLGIILICDKAAVVNPTKNNDVLDKKFLRESSVSCWISPEEMNW